MGKNFNGVHHSYTYPPYAVMYLVSHNSNVCDSIGPFIICWVFVDASVRWTLICVRCLVGSCICYVSKDRTDNGANRDEKSKWYAKDFFRAHIIPFSFSNLTRIKSKEIGQIEVGKFQYILPSSVAHKWTENISINLLLDIPICIGNKIVSLIACRYDIWDLRSAWTKLLILCVLIVHQISVEIHGISIIP